MMTINATLNQLLQKEDLTEESALQCFEKLFSGELSPAQSGAFLFGLRCKGESPPEISAAVKSALSKAKTVSAGNGKTIDTCGTGGDGKKSFNCSTAVALFLADMGYKVVKHGNRAISSNCGSADVMEYLQYPFVKEPRECRFLLEKSNFLFLFAPYFHPAFAKVAPIRMELGIPTLFNLLGPLLNPARPTHQLLGVGDKRYMTLMAKVLALSDVRKAMVVHGAGGFDELTPCGPSEVIFVEDKNLQEEVIDPVNLGLNFCRPEDLTCRNKKQALLAVRSVLQGQGPQALRDMVALNLGACLYLLEPELDLRQSVLLAGGKVEKGIEVRSFYA